MSYIKIKILKKYNIFKLYIFAKFKKIKIKDYILWK